MFDIYLSAFALFLVVIDPIGTAPVFLSVTKNNTVTERVQIAFESVFIASAILVTFSLLGNYIFGYLKISYPALGIAGGIILFLVALKMLFEDPSSETTSIDSSNRISIFPLAVPLLAGAASITSVIVIMNELQGDLLNQTLIISALLTVMLITLAVFYILARTGKFINKNITNVISKVMAIILSGLSIQFIINGIKAINF
ncbi:MAG: MarC family protein [Candidatus Pelagibacterales bacterium]|jgi:multiple antibiotic resistance protein|nr:MarC family protein [Pelagibacterales bacterium]MDB4220313.1 MarC family protein [Pelagibacterales bacterium]|tara:strand:+ start:24 stop:626 length:603 start_codon:yes stop_codon:yes gene_type:complete